MCKQLFQVVFKKQNQMAPRKLYPVINFLRWWYSGRMSTQACQYGTTICALFFRMVLSWWRKERWQRIAVSTWTCFAIMQATKKREVYKLNARFKRLWIHLVFNAGNIAQKYINKSTTKISNTDNAQQFKWYGLQCHGVWVILTFSAAEEPRVRTVENFFLA